MLCLVQTFFKMAFFRTSIQWTKKLFLLFLWKNKYKKWKKLDKNVIWNIFCWCSKHSDLSRIHCAVYFALALFELILSLFRSFKNSQQNIFFAFNIFIFQLHLCIYLSLCLHLSLCYLFIWFCLFSLLRRRRFDENIVMVTFFDSRQKYILELSMPKKKRELEARNRSCDIMIHVFLLLNIGSQSILMSNILQ